LVGASNRLGSMQVYGEHNTSKGHSKDHAGREATESLNYCTSGRRLVKGCGGGPHGVRDDGKRVRKRSQIVLARGRRCRLQDAIPLQNRRMARTWSAVGWYYGEPRI